jgi:parallel beta-helix repeat protein
MLKNGLLTVCLAVLFLAGTVGAAQAGVTITAPANNASVSSPVTVSAYVDSNTCQKRGFNHLQILVNGARAYTGGSKSCSINASVSVPPGTDTITVQAINNNGAVMAQSAITVTAVQRVNGACGSSNGGTFSSAPTTNLCSAGTASAVSGNGPWTWSCAGSNGGSTAQCSANRAQSSSVTITAPPNNASASSPVMVSAYVDSTTCNGGLFHHLQVLVNGTLAYTGGTGSCSINASVNIPSGTDTITVQAVKNDASVMAQSAVTVTGFNSGSGANWYVDNAVSTSGNGTSWSTAWKNFSNINWTSVKPGDTIYISGGSSSKTYYEILIVNDDGTATAPITITKGINAGHNGTVIIDGQMTRGSGVDIRDDNYIVIRGLTVKNHIDQEGVRKGQIFVSNSTGSVIENNNLYVTAHGGVFLQNNTNVIVRNNTITTPTYTTAQTDGVYSQYNTGNIYEGNTIILSNGEPDGHDDGFQSYQDRSITFRGNYIKQDNTKTNHVGNIYIANSYGTMWVYNNVVYSPNASNSLIFLDNSMDNSPTVVGDAVLRAYNNTLYGGEWGVINIQDSPNSVLQNNIIVSNFRDATAVRIKGTLPPAANINYNLYYTPNSTQPFWRESTNTYYTFVQWQGLGYDTNGKNTDPKLKDISAEDFHLQSTSPAIDAGTTISEVTTDKDGTTRPQGSAYDIGAYEKP